MEAFQSGVPAGSRSLPGRVSFRSWDDKQGSLVEILLRCSHLRGLKRLPGIPSAFPILFLGPTLRFQEMKIGWGARPLAKMMGGEKRIINSTVLHLGAIKFVTNAVVSGRGVEAFFQVSKREISSNSRKRDRFAVSLGQFVRGAKIIFAGLVFRHAKPAITKSSTSFVALVRCPTSIVGARKTSPPIRSPRSARVVSAIV